MGFVCPDCSLDCHHPDDIANQYCPRCHTFQGDEAKYWDFFRKMARAATASQTPAAGLWTLVQSCRQSVQPEATKLHAELTKVAIELHEAGELDRSWAVNGVLDTISGFLQPPPPDPDPHRPEAVA